MNGDPIGAVRHNGDRECRPNLVEADLPENDVRAWRPTVNGIHGSPLDGLGFKGEEHHFSCNVLPVCEPAKRVAEGPGANASANRAVRR